MRSERLLVKHGNIHFVNPELTGLYLAAIYIYIQKIYVRVLGNSAQTITKKK